MYTFVVKDADNFCLYGEYEDITPPYWANLDWPIYMVCSAEILNHMNAICKVVAPALAPFNKSLPEGTDKEYYIYPAQAGYIGEYSQIPTGINFKVFDDRGSVVSSEMGLSFELLKLFTKQPGRDIEVGLENISPEVEKA